MKRIVLIGLVVAGIAAAVAIPAFALGPEGEEAAPVNQDTWQAMHEACENGDWEAMLEAAKEVHGEEFDHMGGGMMGGGMMGGGMMGGGMMGGGMMDGGMMDGGVMDDGMMDGGMMDGGIMDGGIMDDGMMGGGMMGWR